MDADTADHADAPVPVEAGADGGVAQPRAMHWALEANSPTTWGSLGGTGPTDVWLVDIGGDTHHTTGDDHWTFGTIADGTRLTGIWAFAPDNVYVSGRINAVYHWDGTGTWDHQVVTSGATFEGIWASGPNDLYALGSGLYRSTGNRTWTYEAIALAEGPLVGIWGSGPKDVWILDGMHNALHGTGNGTWERQRTGLGITPSVAIWGSGSNDIYALAGQTVAHSRGDGSWVLQAVPRVDANETLTCLWGAGPDDLYVGSASGNLYRSVGDGKWYRDPLPPMPPYVPTINSVWGPGRDDVYVNTEIGMFRGHPAN
jgi:hypothetical protein